MAYAPLRWPWRLAQAGQPSFQLSSGLPAEASAKAGLPAGALAKAGISEQKPVDFFSQKA